MLNPRAPLAVRRVVALPGEHIGGGGLVEEIVAAEVPEHALLDGALGLLPVARFGLGCFVKLHATLVGLREDPVGHAPRVAGGQMPRPLQLNATSRSWPRASQRGAPREAWSRSCEPGFRSGGRLGSRARPRRGRANP
jgi:hypothetical protein